MRNRLAHRRLELLEARHLLSATVFEHNNVGYFLDHNQPAIERYDITNEKWLSPISLAGATGTPTVADIDDDGIYVAYGTSVYRYNLDGSNQTHLLDTTYSVLAIHTDGNLLFLNQTNGLYARLISINKTTNTVIDTIDSYIDSVYGSSIAPQVNRIFGRSEGISPPDITYVSYDDNGNFTGNGDSPYHGAYPGASTTWVFPGGTKVVDDSGTVYATDSLTRLNSFASGIGDIGFVGNDIPIVLSGNTLTAYSASILPTGSETLTGTPSNIFVNGTDVIAFTPDPTSSTGYRTQVVPVSDLHAPTPGQPINPVGVPFTPDNMALANDGTLLLYSKSQQSIFRWDPVRQSYGATIALLGAADYMAYSSTTNTIYLAYHSGLIRKIDLNAATPAEVPFATLPQNPIGLSTAGPYVFAVDPSAPWVTHYTFDPNGTLISAVPWNYYSSEYIWSDVNQKMYFFRDDTSPDDLLWEEINANGSAYPGLSPGGIGPMMDSPLHNSAGFTHPIRVSPDGSVVVLGSGAIHDATTLARQTTALANPVSDIAWLGSQLYTIRSIAGVTQFQKWTAGTYALAGVAQISGTPVSLLAIPGGRLLAVTIDASGIPQFTEIDGNLSVIPPPVPVANAGQDVQILLGKTTLLDGSHSFDPDHAPAPLTYRWSVLSGPGAAQFNDPNSALTDFTPSVLGDYSVQLTVSDSVYSATDTLAVSVRTDPSAPVADASLSDAVEVLGRSNAKLDASKSSDADGDTLSYEWSIVSAPMGSHAVIDQPDQKIAHFIADLPGAYAVELMVSDGFLSATTATAVVVRANQPPIADTSGSDAVATLTGTPAKLNGAASSDLDGDSLSYQWKIISSPAGSHPSLQSATSAMAALSADKAGAYTVELTVSDGLASSTADAVVSMIANRAPRADASLSDTQVLAGGFPTLNALGSSDPDSDRLSYAWQLLTSTNGTVPTIENSNQAVATLDAIVPGYYAVSLTVSDGKLTDTDYIIVGVRANHAPVANSSLSATTGSIWTMTPLDGSASSDIDNDPLTYAWSVIASSRGGKPQILHSNQAQALFETDTDGVYTVALTVSDGAKSDTTYTIITISGAQAAPLKGDFDGNGSINPGDLPAMLSALADTSGYEARTDLSNTGWLAVGDMNGDAVVDNGDLTGLLKLLTADAPAAASLDIATPAGLANQSANIETLNPVNFAKQSRTTPAVVATPSLKAPASTQLQLFSEPIQWATIKQHDASQDALQSSNQSILQLSRSNTEGPITAVARLPGLNRSGVESRKSGELGRLELSDDAVDEFFAQ